MCSQQLQVVHFYVPSLTWKYPTDERKSSPGEDRSFKAVFEYRGIKNDAMKLYHYTLSVMTPTSRRWNRTCFILIIDDRLRVSTLWAYAQMFLIRAWLKALPAGPLPPRIENKERKGPVLQETSIDIAWTLSPLDVLILRREQTRFGKQWFWRSTKTFFMYLFPSPLFGTIRTAVTTI